MINESNNEYLAVVILVQREEAVHVYVLKNEIEWILCIKLKYTFISKTNTLIPVKVMMIIFTIILKSLQHQNMISKFYMVKKYDANIRIYGMNNERLDSLQLLNRIFSCTSLPSCYT